MISSSERIHISTPNKYEYQYVKKPARMTQFQVAVKTHNDAHFALSASPHDSAEMLEIVLGGRQNTRSWISVGKMGEPLVSASTPGILAWDEFRSFWISWKGGVVQVRALKQPAPVKHICVSAQKEKNKKDSAGYEVCVLGGLAPHLLACLPIGHA